MNIGIVSYWFNRGQATVGRYIRSIFDEKGHNTFVLARPTKEKFVKSNFISENDVWIQNRVTPGSNFIIPIKEYKSWVNRNNIKIIFFDQNYQFKEIAQLKEMGVKTIGRFVWESFGCSHIQDAKTAFNIIYSLTKCEQERYHNFGIDSPYLRWGIHPELIKYRENTKQKYNTFFYPAGYLSPRKSTGAVVEAFSRSKSSDIRLIIKSQKKINTTNLVVPIKREETQQKNISENDPILLNRLKLLNDSRISVIEEDLSTNEYFSLFSSCHVCLAPSRWEGLGLHLFEAIGFGLPIITNNNSPMNEVVTDQDNGYLVKSTPIGPTRSGIEAFEPDVEDLSRAISYLSNHTNIEALKRNTLEMNTRFHWQDTIKDYENLINTI